MPPMDQAYSALLEDLEQRGLLDETLIVWGGEFGRTPMMENRAGDNNTPFKGRDHHVDAFTMFMEDQTSLLHIREIQNMDAEAIIRWMFKPFTPKPVFESKPYTVETLGDAYLRILKGEK
jgi:hypothetical protein